MSEKKKIVIFTAPNCTKCKILKSKMKDNNIDFEEINIYENEEAKEKLLSKNLFTLPILESNNELIGGSMKDLEERVLSGSK